MLVREEKSGKNLKCKRKVCSRFSEHNSHILCLCKWCHGQRCSNQENLISLSERQMQPIILFLFFLLITRTRMTDKIPESPNNCWQEYVLILFPLFLDMTIYLYTYVLFPENAGMDRNYFCFLSIQYCSKYRGKYRMVGLIKCQNALTPINFFFDLCRRVARGLVLSRIECSSLQWVQVFMGVKLMNSTIHRSDLWISSSGV